MPLIFRSGKSWFIFLCLITGFNGLVLQVVWQKYLSVLLGSEARSTSLVVAFFLLGLSFGYWFWGRRAEKFSNSRSILKAYGWIEFSIGAYAICFHSLFDLIKSFAFAMPDSFLLDLCYAGILIPPASFLMGGTIPLLTKALPENQSEVGTCHSQIYGWNTFGAFAGSIVAGFWMVPALGLQLTSTVAGFLDILAALPFIFNQLDRPPLMATSIVSVANKFPTRFIFLLGFVIGIISIASEVILVRLIGLSLGASPIIFPLVVGIFIAGLAIGSLTLPKHLTADALVKLLIVVTVILTGVYFTAPYWPYWLSNLRVLHPGTLAGYRLFTLTSSVCIALSLWMLVIPMGRILPFIYILLPKNVRNYGESQECSELR